jgi:hypothetical protein
MEMIKMVDEVKENSDVFNELDAEEEKDELVQADDSEDVFSELDDTPKYEKMLKPEDEGKTFIIEKAEKRNPIVKDNMGNRIPPRQMSKTDKTKLGYSTVLQIFLKDTDYVVNVSGITEYVTKLSPTKYQYNPWFQTDVKEEDLDDQFTSMISRLFFKYCKFKKLDITKVGRREFQKGLIGMKVKVKNRKGKFEGKEYVKTEIVDFVE